MDYKNLKVAGKPIQIEIWSDYTCPFCYIGMSRLRKALYKFEHKNKTELILRCFELAPGIHPPKGQSVLLNLSTRKGLTIEYAQSMITNVTKAAKEAGLNFDFNIALAANTFNAHRLVCYANEKGAGEKLSEALFKAHFTDGKDIGDFETLVNITVSQGLEKGDIVGILESDEYADRVISDENTAEKFNVTGVPFFLFNNKYTVKGAQHESLFLELLEKVNTEVQGNN